MDKALNEDCARIKKALNAMTESERAQFLSFVDGMAFKAELDAQVRPAAEAS